MGELWSQSPYDYFWIDFSKNPIGNLRFFEFSVFVDRIMVLSFGPVSKQQKRAFSNLAYILCLRSICHGYFVNACGSWAFIGLSGLWILVCLV